MVEFTSERHASGEQVVDHGAEDDDKRMLMYKIMILVMGICLVFLLNPLGDNSSLLARLLTGPPISHHNRLIDPLHTLPQLQ
jgi:hypothetical protein